jgi:hypothetical protein
MKTCLGHSQDGMLDNVMCWIPHQQGLDSGSALTMQYVRLCNMCILTLYIRQILYTPLNNFATI